MFRALAAMTVLTGLLAVPAGALALDFRSVADPGAVLYDAPSTKAQKLFVLSRDYPVEVVVKVEGWTKVRDDTGEFAWMENKHLSDKRTVMVRNSGAEARQSPSDSAALAFTADKGVLLEFIGMSAGWARIRHPDGETGFIKVSQLWGI
ncbi:MAG TPA: SH3 domain-containing protein [Burkholderiales bacterium]|jgi:SH3-like domain-containing protein